MLHKKTIAVIALSILLTATVWVVAANSLVDEKAVLSGKVIQNGLAYPGKAVREGDVLVNVETLAGIAPAARATVDGTVQAVMVKSGDMIRSGDVVARIEGSRK